MNDDHALAASQIETMQAALALYVSDRAPLAGSCRDFLHHSRDHFAREEAAMRATGFPPYGIHKHEHDRVLAWLDGLAGRIESGIDDASVRQAIEQEIPDWLIRHIQTMDTVTATWLAAHEPVSGVSV